MKTCIKRRFYRFSSRQLLFYTRKDNDIRIDRHTDTKNDTRDPRQRQCDIKCIEQHQDQSSVDYQCKTGCKSRQQIYHAHKYKYNRKSDRTCHQTGTDCFFTKLRSNYIRTDFFQFYTQATDTDRRSQLLCLFIFHGSFNDCLTICNFCIYSWDTDQFTIIIDCDRFFRLFCRFGCFCKFFCTFLCHRKLNNIFICSCCGILIRTGLCTLDICSGQNDRSFFL